MNILFIYSFMYAIIHISILNSGQYRNIDFKFCFKANMHLNNPT